MVTITFTHEGTMKTEEIQVSKEQYKIATDLHDFYSMKYNCSEIYLHTDKKTLVFCVNLIERTLENRLEFELGKHTHKILINPSEYEFYKN